MERSIFMGLFNFLSRLFSGVQPSPDWYVQSVNSVAETLGYQAIWDQQYPNNCILAVEVENQIYYAGAHLEQDSIIDLMVMSKVKAAPGSIGPELARRNRGQLFGSWDILPPPDEGIVFKAS